LKKKEFIDFGVLMILFKCNCCASNQRLEFLILFGAKIKFDVENVEQFLVFSFQKVNFSINNHYLIGFNSKDFMTKYIRKNVGKKYRESDYR
jgi:hypothetical protein